MSTREQARAALVAKVEALKAAWTAYPLAIEYDNRVIVNKATQSKPYLHVSLEYLDGQQIALGTAGGHRLIGVILLEAWAKQGSGVKESNELLQFFYPTIHMTDSMAPLRTYAAKFKSGNTINGWVAEGAVIPFWHDA